MSKEKEIETIVVSFEQYSDLEMFKPPSKYFIVNCMGDRVYYKTKDRAVAQKACDEEYGKGKYKLKTESIDKAPEKVGAVGKINSNSRKGLMQHNMKNRQGRF